MSRRLPLLVLAAALLVPLSGDARCGEPIQEETRPSQEPAKKPDAFQYFFGRKDDEDKKDSKDEAPAVKPSEAAPPGPAQPPPERTAEPAAEKLAEPAPQAVRREPQAASEPAAELPKTTPGVDAFQYFFGQSTQPVPGKTGKAAEHKPVDAFDYFFGKNGKAGAAEEQPESPPPLVEKL